MATVLTNLRGPQGPPGADGADGTIDYASAAFIEAVQDRLGVDLVAGTGITLSYDDAGTGRVTINSTATGGGGTTDAEIVRDTIGAALVAGSGIQVTVDDPGNRITLSVLAGPIGDLTDVSPAAAADGDALLWDAANGRWAPGFVSGGGSTDAGSLTTGQMQLDRMPPGAMFAIDYNKAVYGPAGAWPGSRPTARADLVGVWTGPTDPGTIAVAGDHVIIST